MLSAAVAQLPRATADGETILVERARAGDSAAFHDLVAARLLPTYRLTRAILGTIEEAEDATQEAFIAAWRGIATLRDPARFDAWFGRIVVNACRMSVRQRPRTVLLSVDSMEERLSVSTTDSFTRFADVEALQRAIDRLSVPHRTVLALHYLESRRLSEVGAILGIPVGTAKWRLYQARSALERAMEAER